MRILPSRGAHLVVPRDADPEQDRPHGPGARARSCSWSRGLTTGSSAPRMRRSTAQRPTRGRWLGGRPAARHRQRRRWTSTCAARTSSARTPGCDRSSPRPADRRSRPRGSIASRSRPNGVVRIGGGKYTTYRVMARDVIDAVLGPKGARDRPSQHRRSTAHRGRRPGALERIVGELATVDALVARSDPTRPHDSSPGTGRRRRPSSRSAPSSDLLRPLVPGRPFLEAEVTWAARHELALSLDDVLARRTRLAQELPDRGASIAPRVAELLGAELGWGETRQAREVEAYLETAAPRVLGGGSRDREGADDRSSVRRSIRSDVIGSSRSRPSSSSMVDHGRPRALVLRHPLRQPPARRDRVGGRPRRSSPGDRTPARGWFAAARRHPGRTRHRRLAALIVGLPWPGTSPRRSGFGGARGIRRRRPRRPTRVIARAAVALGHADRRRAVRRPAAPRRARRPSPTPFEPAEVTAGAFRGPTTSTSVAARPRSSRPRRVATTCGSRTSRSATGPTCSSTCRPSAKGYDDGALELGRLKATDGAFGYDLPDRSRPGRLTRARSSGASSSATCSRRRRSETADGPARIGRKSGLCNVRDERVPSRP